MKICGLHWAGHLTYIAAIIAVIFYGKMRVIQVNALQENIENVQELEFMNLKTKTYHIYQSIRSSTCLTPDNQQIIYNTVLAFAKTDTFSIKCDDLITNLKRSEHLPAGNWAAETVRNYFQIAQALKTGSDGTTDLPIPANLYFDVDYDATPEASLASMLQSGDNSSAAQLIRSMQINVNLTLLQLLHTLYKKMNRNAPLNYAAGLPAFSFEQQPQAGKSFHADVYLFAYLRDTPTWSMSATIDKIPIPLEQGIAHYQTVFKNPGEHKIPVSFTLKNELTEELQTYTKEFTVPVSRQ